MTQQAAPVVRREIVVEAPIERAFTVFTERFGDFKPPEHNLLGSPIAETVFEARVGGRSVGVPGTPRLLEVAHARHGRLAWKALFEPAIELATAHGAAYELGMRERDHGMAIQPFPDG